MKEKQDLSLSAREGVPVTSEHAVQTANLPLLHNDPFDRILAAQAMAEGCFAADVGQDAGEYGGPVVTV